LDSQVLQKMYDEFVLLLFAGNTAFPDVVAYRNVLVYTRVELAGLIKGAGKKCGNFSQKSHWTCRYTDRMGRWDIKNRTAEERTFFLNKLRKKLLDKLVRMDSGGWR